MILTNTTGIPLVMYKRIQADLDSDPYGIKTQEVQCFRTTELIGAPLPRNLFKKFRDSDDLVVDAASYISMLFGTILHLMCEGEDVPDKLYYERAVCREVTVDGTKYKVFGTIDETEFDKSSVLVTDNKTCMISNLRYDKPEYVLQLNIYLWLLKASIGSSFVPELRIRYFVKDFSPSKRFNAIAMTKAGTRQRDEALALPEGPIVYKDVPVMPDADIEDYVKERIKDHVDNEFRDCTIEERNFGSIEYKIKHPDRKNALIASYTENGVPGVKITSMAKAQELLKTVKPELQAGAFIEKQAEDKKCRHYCQSSSLCLYAKSKNY